MKGRCHYENLMHENRDLEPQVAVNKIFSHVASDRADLAVKAIGDWLDSKRGNLKCHIQ